MLEPGQNTNLNLKREVLLQVLDNHDEERQLDAECLRWICRTCDKRRAETINSKLYDTM